LKEDLLMQRAEFGNEPFTDFSNREMREKMQRAIAQVESQLGREYSMVIGGKRVKAADQFMSHDPSDPDRVVGVFQKGTAEVAARAIEAAWDAFPDWSRTTAEQRAGLCFRVADMMRERRFELNAWAMLEVGKSWVEADADVAEGIDLVEFYGHEALRYGAEQPVTKISTEDNELRYIPLGVGAVIPPWNFPIAIMAGMTTATIAAGNTAVLKPSSDAPACAKVFVGMLEEAGLPPGVVNLVTGPGGDAGEALVAHPRTRFVTFTGSKEVGLRINEMAARHQPGQIWIKRVIAEMGGKNAIVVDDEADLEQAAQGVLASAFGYSGQKCSACSRAIVVNSVHDQFLHILLEKAKSVKVGPVKNPDVFTGPVINMRALATILNYIEMGCREGKLVLGGKRIGDHGFFVEPTIFVDVPRKATIAQEEIFGPVLAVIRAQDYDDALDIANDTEYGLTGSVYTQNRAKMEMAKQRFHVGNLYFNRKCTGALVGAHPFGGFNMSGTDSKAGGRDYLLLLTQAKSISEKIA
jgi:1-pyrroline-5-carboxylate dehydrogenase